METKLWLDCFLDILKMALFLMAIGLAYVMGYEARKKDEKKRYEIPKPVKRARRTARRF